jgi:hypothetical protein
MDKIVIIVGAGASKEVGLPLGFELKNQISSILHPFIVNNFLSIDDTFSQTMESLFSDRAKDFPAFKIAAKKIYDGLPLAISIDNLLDAHKDDLFANKCGKVAIAQAILNAERNSSIFIDETTQNRIDFNLVEGTWFSEFHKLLTENCQYDNLKYRLSHINIINFNYDRCIEHFFYYALKTYYTLSDKQAKDVINIFNVFHPYGSIGNLPFSNSASYLKFGEQPTIHNLFNASQNLSTFTEDTNPLKDHMYKKLIAEANKIVFIGFAYHPQNLALLQPDFENVYKAIDKQIIGTSYDISDSNSRSIHHELLKWCGASNSSIELKHLKCHDFINEFWRSLSFKE